jgi:hypothetical protein
MINPPVETPRAKWWFYLLTDFNNFSMLPICTTGFIALTPHRLPAVELKGSLQVGQWGLCSSPSILASQIVEGLFISPLLAFHLRHSQKTVEKLS